MLPGLLAEEALIVLLQVMTFLVSDPVSCTKGWPRNPWICKKIMLLWMWHETSHPEKFLNSESRIEKWKNYSLLLVLPILIPLQLIWFLEIESLLQVCSVLCLGREAFLIFQLGTPVPTVQTLHQTSQQWNIFWNSAIEKMRRKYFCYHDSNVKSIDSMILVLPRWNLQIHCGTELNGLSAQFTAGHLAPWHVGRWKAGGVNKPLTMEVVFWWALVHLPTRSWASQTPALECHDPHCLVSSESLEENPRCYSLLPWFKNVKNPL